MTNDLISLIKERMPSLTKAERKVAALVLNNAHTIMNLSITELAQQFGVSDTSIFRFCKKLNLEGYQDFKMSLVLSLSNNGITALTTLSDQIKVDDSLDEVCRKLLATNIDSLRQTFEKLDYNKISAAVNMIEQARLIQFYGIGASGVMALEAKNRFARILPNLIFEGDTHMQEMSSALLGPDDLAIAFSYSGSSKDTISVLKRAKENGAKCLCITSFPDSHLTTYADLTLLCSANEGPFQGGSLCSRIAQLYLLDVLYTEFFKNNFAACDLNKKLTTQAIASKLL